MITFLRNNSLLRGNDEGLTHCEGSAPEPTGPTGLWIREFVPGAGVDTHFICIVVPDRYQQLTVAVTAPDGSSAGEVRVTPDENVQIRTLRRSEPGFALIGSMPNSSQQQYVGMTERAIGPRVTGWVVELVALLPVNRPEGDWLITVSGALHDGRRVAISERARVANHCDRTPPASYNHANLFLVSPNARLWQFGPPQLTHRDNCRFLRPMTGEPAAAAAQELISFASYGGFNFRQIPGNCGLRVSPDSLERDNRPDLVDQVAIGNGDAYFAEGSLVTLTQSITCPELPADLFEVKTTSSGFRYWGAAPRPYREVASILTLLGTGFGDWRWTAEDDCVSDPEREVMWLSAREAVPWPNVSGFELNVEPGSRVPTLEVGC